MLNQEQFLEYGKQGFNLVPLWQILPLPPQLEALSLYRVLCMQGNDYLFETGQWEGGNFQRHYSIIGLPAAERIEIGEHWFKHIKEGEIIQELSTSEPLDELERLLASFRVPQIAALPPFSGGLFGYFGFETTRLIEPRLARQPRKPSGLDVPDVVQLVSKELLVFDHRQSQLFCIVHDDPGVADSYLRTHNRLYALCEHVLHKMTEIATNFPAQTYAPKTTTHAAPALHDELTYAFPRAQFEQAVGAIKTYIAAGDVMQVVLSQRMSRSLSCDAPTLYQALRSLGQTPYSYIVDLGQFQVVGASPEMLVQRQTNTMTSRPMAGTRRRGADASADLQLTQELLADPKEIAEHMMLLDLARNDLGRVAEVGSVQVKNILSVEYFSHVMHIVSTVTGLAPSQLSGLEVFKSTFPAGTLSGASKIRALEVIAQLEPHARGIYGGAIGCMDWHGGVDLAIAIRTGVLQAGILQVQAGAGVVQDSVAEREWQETIEKSRMMLLAAQLAQSWQQEMTVLEDPACI
ncbi:anthranilate synthase component I family protein [Solimicrobium silvestre]|uniref:Anthranilate synthase component 1 n=1 Tax=Solimicrobium silvestre TaxID=2099400 RepID=A0A2S9H2W6_9BURK|nr:anthranilate synthase component I family protein [Solimicrobium silvestre]PRC94283.1 Anthranilate/para-aminobenzoate synthases component I [Solimicrobium silvestre]